MMFFIDRDLSHLPELIFFEDAKALMSMLPKNSDKIDLTIREFLGLIQNGFIKAYPHNRGTGKYNTETVKSLKTKGLKMGSFGELVYGYYADSDTPGFEMPVLCINSGHSRTVGLLDLLIEGQLSEEELDNHFSFRYSDNFIEDYQCSGVLGTGHGTKEKALNPDLAFGNNINRVLDGIFDSEKEKEAFKRRMATPLQSILLKASMDDSKESWRWRTVYSNRSKHKKLAGEKKGAVEISNRNLQKIRTAIIKYKKIIKSLSEKAKESKINVNKIKNSSGFFGVCICDFYNDKNTIFVKILIVIQISFYVMLLILLDYALN